MKLQRSSVKFEIFETFEQCKKKKKKDLKSENVDVSTEKTGNKIKRGSNSLFFTAVMQVQIFFLVLVHLSKVGKDFFSKLYTCFDGRLWNTTIRKYLFFKNIGASDTTAAGFLIFIYV